MPNISDCSVMLFPWDAKKPKVADIVEAAKLAEDLGFYSVTLPTHMTTPPGWLFSDFDNRELLDAKVIVPAIAAATSRIKIGFNSLLPPLLPPYEWAKYLSTLDVMSDGRVIFGAAEGWWEEDFAAVGVNRKFRASMFNEQLEVITSLWTQDKTTFDGKHYQLKDMTMEPKPVQKPYPPIWIGGSIKSVYRAARYDGCIVAFWPDADAARNLWVPKLKEEGEKWGTDPKLCAFSFVYVAKDKKAYEAQLPNLRLAVAFEDDSIDPGTVTVSGSPERCAEQIKSLADAGVWHFVLEFQFHGLESVSFGMAQMEAFAKDVVPLL
ncbi:MAG: LLM class flavin-dependent oxidoreductase [Gammaproteobacteria bacterium]|nr:LLM class flavin-dependent oxidoreductase [Gammaproteobacteria bacterium]